MSEWTWVSYTNHLESIMSRLGPVDDRGPRVPIELCERVIDWIGNDWDGSSLCACSLTCHAWLPRSRHRLYERIELKTWTMMSQPESSKSYIPTRLQRLVSTFRAHRILYGYVRYLSIDPSHTTMGSFPQYGERDNVSALCVSLFFPYPLRNLKELHLKWLSLALTHSQFFRALSLHTSVTTLSVVRVSFAMSSQVARLIHCFPALSTLHVEDIDVIYNDNNTLNPTRKSEKRIPRLSTLKYVGEARHFEGLVKLALPVSLETVRSLEIRCWGFAAISTAIARAGSSLVNFVLETEFHETTTPSPFGGYTGFYV